MRAPAFVLYAQTRLRWQRNVMGVRWTRMRYRRVQRGEMLAFASGICSFHTLCPSCSQVPSPLLPRGKGVSHRFVTVFCPTLIRP